MNYMNRVVKYGVRRNVSPASIVEGIHFVYIKLNTLTTYFVHLALHKVHSNIWIC